MQDNETAKLLFKIDPTAPVAFKNPNVVTGLCLNYHTLASLLHYK